MENIGLDQNEIFVGVFGDPKVIPRVGDKYQVHTPELISRGDYIWYMITNPDDTVKWINTDPRKMEYEKEFPSEPWSDMEKASFLIGLYIFGKNFAQIQRFVGKKMKNILPFYYRQFYRSNEYISWSTWRKMRKRMDLSDISIFSESKPQQQLLTRILQHVSDECKNTLLEISKAFEDKKMTLGEYFRSLKALVGMEILVEAVGIGKGKQDITVMDMASYKPVKKSSIHQVPRHSTRQQIPTGEACSSLTPTEIVKFIKSLRKARCNDLFWEAVWPRLLARGWKSEQPKNYHSLVFLVPGVEKFLRSLVKGTHYFDSLSDVLSKVTSEPGLLELNDSAEDEGNNPEESRTLQMESSGQRSLPNVSESDNAEVSAKRQRKLMACCNEETSSSKVSRENPEVPQPWILIDLNIPLPDYANDASTSGPPGPAPFVMGPN